ncbi:hypothetical protein PILCRDRAFT_90233 [Piloderma croceum F 1598]|uniref:Protein kinase domain-containing protein n=1 Tax=Piloderma croceum (strain F 1598) TaxID=765440 RepID=A0A0C3F3M1_PILCF|nr:hypothetical protein PILCRDRAFT_90233 [Piloderma croceum F 1598]
MLCGMIVLFCLVEINNLMWILEIGVCYRVYVDKVASLYKNILVSIWSPLSHDHVAPLLGVHANGHSPPELEVPFYKKGNILEHNRRSPGADKFVQIAQIAAGISYLHEEGVEHGNICPTNILIKDDGDACISDPCINSLMRQLKYDTHVPIPATWCYKPREELLSDTSMGPKADVYAWASVVYEVFSGKRPYSAYRQTGGIIRIINDGHRTLDRPLEISPKLWGIMQKCWKINAADRPTMPQVIGLVQDKRYADHPHQSVMTV